MLMSLMMKEMEILKNMIKYYLTHIRLAFILKKTSTGKDVEKLELLYIMESNIQFPQKLKNVSTL
jgi:hypothetical protein